ncbi:DUF523 domain-containing protein [Lysinibacillus fusiformis]|uniref:DUF523 domain-containing protein n=1 Tax=Lysinibacillus fusiformis TaxID=28031 RepID=UPI003019C6DD
MILISACLAGLNVRYNGTNCIDDRVQKLVLEKKAITVCPELMGGFSTPREPAEIVGGNGDDVLDGKATVIERSGRETQVVLKENSPSCGSAAIYNGEFNGTKIVGEGVTTALLRRNNIVVLSEEDI